MSKQTVGIAVAIACCLGPFAVARAQRSPSDSGLSLAHALAIAEARAPGLRGRASEVAGARSNVTLADQHRFPSLDIGGQLSSATDNNITGASFGQPVILPVSGPVRLAASGSPVYGSAYGALLSWTPITFGQVSAQRKQAKAELDVALDDASASLFDLRVRVSAAFLELLRANELVRVQAQSLARADTVARSIRVLVASGLRSEADSLLANADVSRARIDWLTARRNASSTAIRLTELLGASDVPAALDARPFLERVPPDDDTTAATRATVATFSRHPVLLPFIARVSASDAHVAAVSRSAFPRVSVLGGLSSRGSGIAPNGDIDRSFSAAFSGERLNLAAGVMMSFPVMDALFLTPRTDVERARAESDRAVLDAQTDHLRAQLGSAEADLGLAIETSREVPTQLAAARGGFDRLAARYAAGLTTQAELAQAQYAVTRAEGDAVSARVGAWEAWLNVCAARGDLVPFLRYVQ